MFMMMVALPLIPVWFFMVVFLALCSLFYTQVIKPGVTNEMLAYAYANNNNTLYVGIP